MNCFNKINDFDEDICFHCYRKYDDQECKPLQLGTWRQNRYSDNPKFLQPPWR